MSETPMWSVGAFAGSSTPKDDDKTGLTSIEARLVEVLEKEYLLFKHAEIGLYQTTCLYRCRGIKSAWDSLYYPREGEPWENDGCSKAGFKLQLLWQSRIY